MFNGEITIAARLDLLTSDQALALLAELGEIFPANKLSDLLHGFKAGSAIGEWVTRLDPEGNTWTINNFSAKQARKFGSVEITTEFIDNIKGSIPDDRLKITDINDYKGSGAAQLDAWNLS